MNLLTEVPNYHFEPQHLPDVLEAMIVLKQNSKNVPSENTHLWLSLPNSFGRQVAKAAGLSFDALLPQSALPSVYVPITSALKKAIEATSIMEARGKDCYLQVSESGVVQMKYQQIIGGRLLTPPDPMLLDQIMRIMTPKLLANKDFTDPTEVFRPAVDEVGHGQSIRDGKRMSARLLETPGDKKMIFPFLLQNPSDLLNALDKMVVTVHQDYASRPSNETHLHLLLSQKVMADAIEKAGLNRAALLGHSSMPQVYIPLTPALKLAVYPEDEKRDRLDAYLVLYDKGVMVKRGFSLMQQTLALETPSIVDKVVTLLAQEMQKNPGFTNPHGKYGRRPEFENVPIEPLKRVDNPSTHVSAPPRHQTLEMFATEKLQPLVEPTMAANKPAVASPATMPSKARSSKASASVLSDLSQLTVDPLNPSHLKLPLVHLANYKEVKELLLKAGGKYNSKGYFSFPEGIELAQVHLALMAGAAVNGKKDVQFFATPPDVAQMLCDNAGPMKGLRVLEPSAGDGALADIARSRGANVTVIENWPVNVVKLKTKGYDVIDQDFLTVKPGEIGLFDVILANPPFTKNQDIDHVRHMMDFLEPGGVLSVITSQSWVNGNQKKQQEFSAFLADMDAVITPVEAGAFKTSGTGVSTLQIVLRAPGLGLRDDADQAPVRKGPRP